MSRLFTTARKAPTPRTRGTINTVPLALQTDIYITPNTWIFTKRSAHISAIGRR